MTQEALPPSPTRETSAGDKSVAFYSAAVQAWIDTRMERDRTLITLSTAGLGLLVTLLTTVGLSQQWQVYLYGVAGFGFIVTLGICIWVYGANARHIESVLANAAAVAPEKKRLKQLDALSLIAFLVGAVALTAIGVTSAIEKGPANVRAASEAQPQEGAKEPAGPRQADSGESSGPGQAPATPAAPVSKDST